MEIAHRRLLSQHIAGKPLDQPQAVVRWMGAMQAQDYQQAVWAIGLRTQAGTLSAVEQAIADRMILQTWPMRGTIHFVVAENAKWMLELSAPRSLTADRLRLRQLELDERILARCSDLFHAALQGGKRLTRAGMMQLLADAQISPAGQRGYHILWYLAQTGLICFGPMQGKEQTFVLLNEWVPDARQLSREEALAELAGRYFASHGPATLDDFARWAGLTLTDARSGLELAKPVLASEKQDARTFWFSINAPDMPTHDPSSLYLLPGFDEYLLGYKDRNDMLAAEHANRIVPGGNGIFLPMIVVGGQIVGTWKRTRKKKGLEITLLPFISPSVSQAQMMDQAAERYSAFLGLRLASLVILEV